MNKNTLIGLLLIGVILFGFSWYTNKTQMEQIAAKQAIEREQYVKDSITLANTPKQEPADTLKSEAIVENIAPVIDSSKLDGIVRARVGTEELVTIENELIKLTFSNKGGRIAAVELKDYKKYGGDPLMLFKNGGSNFGISFYAPEYTNTAELYLQPKDITANSITYRLSADSASYMEFVYRLRPNDYMMDMTIDMSHFKGRLAQNQPDIVLDWQITAPHQEKGFSNENTYTTIAYKFPGTDYIDDLGLSDKETSEEISTKVQWVGFKQQFFSSIIVSKENFEKSKIGFNTYPQNSENIKDFRASLTLPYTPTVENYNFNFYFGPNKYSTLKSYDDLYFQKLVPLGWGIFGWVNRFVVIPVFDFLGGFITNFGMIIILLTLFIKLLILPLTYKSYLSTAKMRLLKPEIDKITSKFPAKEDALKKQQATMALYKSAGVSPMGGCMPMLIQMPILIAMFRFFPAAIELRQESFLWADDLSSYDSIWTFPGGFSLPFYGDHISLFTLLMAVMIFINSRISYSQQSMGSTPMPGMKFMTLYLMPTMMIFWFNSYASGLTFYYFVSTLITVGIMYGMRFIVNDDKLHMQMKENAKKPVKKSKWAERLEEMQKQANAQQAQQAHGKGKKK